MKRRSKQMYSLRVRQTICSYCGEVSTARTTSLEEKRKLAHDHILICKKRPEMRLIDRLIAAADALKSFGKHKQSCNAFPASSEEQIARDCSCGLQKALEAVQR